MGQSDSIDETVLSLESLKTEYQTTLFQYNHVYSDYMNFLQIEAPPYIIIGCGTDGFLYSRYGLDGTWAKVSDNSDGVISICTMTDGIGLLGVMGQSVYMKPDYRSNWVGPVQNPSSVTSVAMGQNGNIVGVYTDNTLYTKTTLNGTWTQTATTGEWCSSVAIGLNGTIFVIGTGNNIYQKSSYQNLTTQSWTDGCSGTLIAMTIAPDGTFIGVGTDNQLYSQPDYTNCSNWSGPYTSSCCIVGVTTVTYKGSLSEIKGKAFWGTAGLSEGASTSLENCKAMCSSSTSCTGATFNSDKQYCWTRSGEGATSAGLGNDYAIIPTNTKFLTTLGSLNQQLTTLNSKMSTIIKKTAGPSFQAKLNNMAVSSTNIQTNYSDLTKERIKIKKLISDFENLDQAQIEGEVTINSNYYSFILLFLLAGIFISCLIMLSPKPTSTSTTTPAPVQSGGDLSNYTYYIVFIMIAVTLFIYYSQKLGFKFDKLKLF